ncbi:hypothetical protein AL062_22260 [Pseudomonas syringae pv. syringae]|nr:hypothetical protein AL062_22260 [Pseudomonas syringae pv. syringae]
MFLLTAVVLSRAKQVSASKAVSCTLPGSKLKVNTSIRLRRKKKHLPLLKVQSPKLPQSFNPRGLPPANQLMWLLQLLLPLSQHEQNQLAQDEERNKPLDRFFTTSRRPAGAFSFLHKVGNDFMKFAIATLVLTVLSIFFLEFGQQLSAQLLTQIGAGGLVATFLAMAGMVITS